MTNRVTKEHLNNYIEQNYKEDDVDEITNPSKVFEAFSEMVVDLNPEYEISLLTESYENQDLDIEDYLELKLQRVLDDSIDDILSKAQKNKWIKYAKNGIEEYKYLDQCDDDRFNADINWE